MTRSESGTEPAQLTVSTPTHEPGDQTSINWVTPNWPPIQGVHALTSCCTGGVSSAGFSSLNLASHVGDDPMFVAQNRARLTTQANLPAAPCWLDQQHGNQIVNCSVQAQNQQPPVADGCYTDQPNQVCAVLTADCLPILIRSADGLQLAAIHAGWRGLYLGVIGNGLKQFSHAGQPASAWIGPAIGSAAYQVNDELMARFINLNRDYQGCFKPVSPDSPVSPGQWQMDMTAIATQQLLANGISEVFTSGICCYQDQRFYSHRRNPNAGRMVTLIWRD